MTKNNLTTMTPADPKPAEQKASAKEGSFQPHLGAERAMPTPSRTLASPTRKSKPLRKSALGQAVQHLAGARRRAGPRVVHHQRSVTGAAPAARRQGKRTHLPHAASPGKRRWLFMLVWGKLTSVITVPTDL